MGSAAIETEDDNVTRFDGDTRGAGVDLDRLRPPMSTRFAGARSR
jgi:hypothetical protein